MKQLKCNNCGAPFKDYKCPYCGSEYVGESRHSGNFPTGLPQIDNFFYQAVKVENKNAPVKLSVKTKILLFACALISPFTTLFLLKNLKNDNTNKPNHLQMRVL